MTLLLLLAALQQPPDRDDPRAQLESFKLPEGFEINLWASEREGVVKPIQMRWDAQGRLWVTCSPSYPQVAPGDRADDRIVVLEDADRDGRAEKSTLFARGLTMPLGIELGRGGVFAGDGTELVHLRDTDGDGRADHRRVILRGFFTGDSHQSINNFVWGPGGELFFCQGLHAFGNVETPWGVESLHKAGVWRFRDRRMRLEGFFGDDMGPQNPYGIAFDDWGQPILVAGNGQGIYPLRPALVHTRHFLQYAPVWSKGAKFGGADLIGTPAMPDDLQGLLVSGFFMNNTVALFQISEEGAGFRARDLPPLVVSRHVSFRPVDAKVGPDGAIYIADWYNPVIGHYQASLRHPDRDKTHGRIWRITAKGRTSSTPPPLAGRPLPELLDHLRSPERWVRYQAKRLLADADGAETARALAAWLKTDPGDERLLVDALGVHESHEIVEPRLLARVLAARDPRARAYAANVIGHWHDRLENPLDLLVGPARDPDPRVRLAAVVAASSIPQARSIEVAAAALDHPMDRFLTHALTQAVHALKPWWKPAFERGELSFGGRAERLQFVLQAEGTKDVLQPILKRVRSADLKGEARANMLAALARVGGPDELAIVLEEAVRSGSGRLLEELRLRKTKPSGDFARRLEEFPAANDPALLALAGRWRVESLRPRVEAAAREAADAGVRRAAFRALADFGAVDLLAELSMRLLSESPGEPGVTLVVETFLGRKGGAEALAEALGKTPLSADAAKLALRAMSSAGRQEPALRAVLEKAAGIGSGTPEHSAELVKALVAGAAAEGDAARGEKIFRGAITNCLSCHGIGGAGGRAGPDLSPVGTALPADLIVESLLWPNRQVKEGYATTLVVTSDERMIQGYRVNEDKQRLVLRDPNTDEPIILPVGEIRAQRETGSVMPEGLTNGLTRGELHDLVRFLTELGKPGPFRVPDRPFVRHWWVPAPGAGPWLPRFSMVSGELPREDLAAGRARFEVEIAKPGRYRLQLNGIGGLALRVDGKVVPLSPSMNLVLEAGKWVFDLDVDASRTAGLTVTIEPAP